MVVDGVTIEHRWRGKSISQCSAQELEDALAYAKRRPLVLINPITREPFSDAEQEYRWHELESDIIAAQHTLLAGDRDTESKDVEK